VAWKRDELEWYIHGWSMMNWYGLIWNVKGIGYKD